MDTTNSTDELFMCRCLDLAAEAQLRGDTAVGCVIVAAGREIAAAGETAVSDHDIVGHAEIAAVRLACRIRASFDLSDCTLYTNVEPCYLCTYAIRETGIAKVIYGVPASGIGGATSGYPILTATDITNWGPPPVVLGGVLADESRALLAGTHPDTS